ncbi:general transcription factor IIH subunit 4-like isoform X1 [Orbicella faveolata]|uniref:general transcription factor IIH subunit 4-like isoform X1 n=1 Tax=Orbicella faveolata TaxID=48498 RepID=UPI0009E42C68|nr:general transcription factor IIH subunit 4-like isoform X1 [Orbicella faveolata]
MAAADLSSSSFFRHLQCRDLHQYLGSLPSGILDRLYNHPAICLAVFRELPELAKQFVMRTLFADQPIPETLVAAWVKSEHQKHYIGSLNRLKGLRIWKEASGRIPNRLEMNAIFRSNLKIALCGGGNPWIGSGDQPEKDKHARDITFLDKYSMERWEAVLHFMTGYTSTEEGAAVSQDVVKVLVLSGLMKCETPGNSPIISPAGFQFLLMDTASQVWYFMLQYLETVEGRDMDLVECLSFLFQISFATLGKDYSTEGMSESQLKFLQHLREFGLVFQRKRKSRRYYPTRLAINLASAGIGSTSVTNTDEKGFIVVETNYRLYAYTSSSLQVALVGLFSEILCRFPNLCVAVLTRDSVQQALSSGISAEQILHFLRTRAHPEMLKKNPIIPPTISDQIRLWELERSRMKFTEGVLYNQFLSQADFETLKKYAEDLGVLMWANSSKRVIVVSRSGHDDVKRFWKRQKQNT